MKLIKKEEVFEFDHSIENINIKPYSTNRIQYQSGEVVWFGISINWKRIDNIWHVLTTNHKAKPLEKYLPEIVYGEDRTIWVECDMPTYEKYYQEYYKDVTRDKLLEFILFKNE